MNSTRDDFLQHAQRVRSLLDRHFNEASTRVYLIDPMLSVLGYFGPDEVGIEVPLPATKEFIDYELYSDGKALAIVEAKALDQAITEQAAAQCTRYAFILGVRWCLITNGVTWLIYDAYCRGELRDKHVATVRLDGDEASLTEAWNVLSLFSRESLAQANPLTHLLVRRVVDDELSRPESAAISVLRKAVRDRFGERVSGQAVIDAIARLEPNAPKRPANEGQLVRPAGEDSPLGNGFSAKPSADMRSSARRREGTLITVADLVKHGLIPPDAEFVGRHNGRQVSSRLTGDRINFEDGSYPNLSSAATAARGGGSVNGWLFWAYGGESLRILRDRLNRQLAGTEIKDEVS